MARREDGPRELHLGLSSASGFGTQRATATPPVEVMVLESPPRFWCPSVAYLLGFGTLQASSAQYLVCRMYSGAYSGLGQTPRAIG